jgi:hypothetical protein
MIGKDYSQFADNEPGNGYSSKDVFDLLKDARQVRIDVREALQQL